MARFPSDIGLRRDLLQLAWPAALAMVVHQSFRLNDQYFVGDLGVEAQAAVAVGSMVAIFLLAFGEMVGVGTLAIASRRLGEGNADAGHATIRRGLRLGILVGAVLAVASLTILPWLGERLVPGEDSALVPSPSEDRMPWEPEPTQAGGFRSERRLVIDYLTWIAGGQAIMAAVQVMDQGFLALKDTRTSLALQILAVAANASLNWILVPEFGVHGVGAATLVSRLVALVVGLSILRARGVGGLLGSTRGGASPWRILRIGLPVCVAIGIYSLVYQVIVATTLDTFGPAARSALGIGFGIETMFYCVYWGVGAATAGLVGRYLGEGEPHKVLATTGFSIRLSLGIGVAISAVLLVFGETMVAAFSGDPEVVRINTQYLHYMAIAQPFQALQVAFDNALMGAGSTLPLMIGNTTSNLVRIPLTWILAILGGYGLPGVWWAMNISSIGKCVWSGILYTRRRWLTIEV